MGQPRGEAGPFISSCSCAGSRASQDRPCIGQLYFGKTQVLCCSRRAWHLKPPFPCCCGCEKVLCRGCLGRQSLRRREKGCGIFCLSVFPLQQVHSVALLVDVAVQARRFACLPVPAPTPGHSWLWCCRVERHAGGDMLPRLFCELGRHLVCGAALRKDYSAFPP